ncbi:NAD(P)-dependent dehydrogenase, short-chain alcohol dehydrogenase family [Pseudomonas sp. URIL14HWK12:I9]|nr:MULTISPECIES: SDR family oxidoreductase [unclassified Pseudomonas]PVZ16197.1 NAD(P)-dependent dehydrogenase (short-subunit alcohol dehydrogenase family) [Pseudomonas sp. URIL14HWK12:I12]PVZ25947.1 NAD(P)-dependent dehydrogenase (short-subunit alcohol dehydrogenase family) [Pseudomonas sp. URIL14HWK12:I10]PVZ36529.1 NAD(P)-dependent dehydrogenase (short-subunit alcohol dehydrogenase family) [Pseudomonas sp. URIL14HWK12:I11]SNZ13261.1 NAD(P)-dependent dehydrogenase, short-chain alcohol dehydro
MIEVGAAGGSFHDGRVALVTGAARGIGLGVAAWLICEGWRVALADIDQARGQKVAQALGDRAMFIALDVADESQAAAAVEQTMARFGRLDALVNNAAIADPHSRPLEHLTLAHWNRVLAVNLTGAMLLARHAVPYLRVRNGAIVNIASTRAVQSEPDSEAYAASKGGLVALTHALAVSLGPEIRVNAVSPGWIDVRDNAERRAEPLSAADHAQHPAGRVGTVEDVAALVAWLLSAQASFVTGQAWQIDGGMARKMIYT